MCERVRLELRRLVADLAIPVEEPDAEDPLVSGDRVDEVSNVFQLPIAEGVKGWNMC